MLLRVKNREKAASQSISALYVLKMLLNVIRSKAGLEIF